MEAFIAQIEWIPVLSSVIVTFILGWLWYSPALFLKPWLKGIPDPPKWQAPMWMPLSAHAGSLLFLAIVVQTLLKTGQVVLLVLVAFTVMGFIKSNGMYAGKNKIAISIEVLYILASVLLMVLLQLVL